MGKGARNRASRRAEAKIGLSEELIGELFAVSSAADLLELLNRRPDLERGQAADDLRAMAEMPGFGAGFAGFVELIAEARHDLPAAWARFEQWRAEIDRTAEELEQVLTEVEAAAERLDHDTVVTLAAPAARRAEAAGLGLGAGRLYSQLGLALLRRVSADRARDLEAAIEAHEAALGFAERGEWTANLVAHLGLVYSERVRGDRADNLERAAGLLRSALEELPAPRDPELDAQTRTNLAMALMRGERGDRRAVLHEAAALCREALRFRSPDRNAVDWAYSQLNLGEALEELARLDGVVPEEALQAYQRVVSEASRVGEPWLVGGAHHALGRLRLRMARGLAAQLEEWDDEADDEPDPAIARERLQLLQHAGDDLARADGLMVNPPDPMRRGFLLNDLSDVLAQLERDDEAIARSREALAILRPTASPRACMTAGARLGNLLAERGEWEESAGAFRDAVEAAELSFHGRLDTESREAETRRAGNLSRWAAFAIAAAGDPLGAALVLENGRARELRRRLGLDGLAHAELAALPVELHDALQTAAGELAAAPLGSASAEAAYQLQAVLSAIRERPGLERFATGAASEDLAAALEPKWPLMYVNPTPYGTLLLQLRLDGTEIIADAELLDAPRALDVFLQLIIGHDEAGIAAAEDPDLAGSYLFGITGQGDSDLHVDIQAPLPWLGASIARPVRDAIVRAGATGVTLICCGPISASPLHASSWQESGQERCLLDDLEVRYAPSALLGAAALRRAADQPGDQRLVVLADPTGDLPASRPEAREIAQHFPTDRTVIAVGAAADHAFLEQNARRADYLHLACHADGSLFEGDQAAVHLADGPMSAQDLVALRNVRARSTVISACQSGMAEISGLPDEVFSIGTAMLAAGSASAIASLWPVDDLATALLMTRLYDEMVVASRRPPEALRRAQLWLREVTNAEETAFLAKHPTLAAEYRRRASIGDLPGRRSAGLASDAAPAPYAHPDYWAAFVALGA